MSNSRILIISLGVIAASFVALVALPKVSHRTSSPNQTTENLRVDSSPRTPDKTPEPKVMTFAEFYATLTPEEKACVGKSIAVGRSDALEQGSEAVTDAELEVLNTCISPPTPEVSAGFR